MMKQLRRISFSLFATLAILACAGHAPGTAQERFEVSSVKAVRPHLVNTVTAIQQRDIAKAKAAFEAYDSAWNGIEVYIVDRNRGLYEALELNLQAKITKALESPNPDMAALLADAQAILAKYDEAISFELRASMRGLYRRPRASFITSAS